MAGFIPQGHRGVSHLGGLASLAAALVLAGCSGTTYGTGTSPGIQTVQDLAGIALIGGPKKDPIDYTPRPKVVLPPTVAALPPPGSDDNSATPADWPNDPDVSAAKIKSDAAAREASGAAAPALVLPAASLARKNPDGSDAPLSAEDQAKVKKLFADARGGVAFDAAGNPVRKYLTDPPADYRVPDPTAPVAFTPKKKKFHWWWQKDDNSDDNLEPSPTTTTTTATTTDGSTPMN